MQFDSKMLSDILRARKACLPQLPGHKLGAIQFWHWDIFLFHFPFICLACNPRSYDINVMLPWVGATDPIHPFHQERLIMVHKIGDVMKFAIFQAHQITKQDI